MLFIYENYTLIYQKHAQNEVHILEIDKYDKILKTSSNFQSGKLNLFPTFAVHNAGEY